MKMKPQIIEDLVVALIKFGWTESEVERLSGGDELLHLRAMLELSPHLLNPPKTVVLSDHSCKVRGYRLNQHLMYDDIDWNPELFQLVPAESRYGGWDFHNKIQKSHKPLNANLLNHLLVYPYLIPESWRLQDGQGRKVFFHGTTYQGDSAGIYIRGMSFREEDCKWHESMVPVMEAIGPSFTALVFA